MSLLKLNLGCGENKKPGFVNVDKYGQPDQKVDLEVFPWPWDDSSVSEIVMNHVMEHLGQRTDVYLGIVKELYRVCCNQAKLEIAVPHPRHDNFLNDPTHVRPVTVASLELFSKRKNEEWIRNGQANSPLAKYLDVDLEVVSFRYVIDEAWAKQVEQGKITLDDVMAAEKKHNNVVKTIHMVLTVVKPET